MAILVVDSCGFTHGTRQRGIVRFLASLERLQRLALPLIERHRGEFLRAEADNLFAIFPNARAALRCATDLLRDIDVANEALPADDEIGVAAGIGFGDVLVVGDRDLYGDEMNLTCKLGEDLAGPGEILLTPNARSALPPETPRFEEAEYSISGLRLTAYRLLR